MRVIGGEFRSRKLKSPPGLETRPTPDRLRESLFNILAPHIGDAVFVDAYAGGGSVGIEALSRGARRAVFIERSKPNVAIIQENLKTLNAVGRATVITGNAATYLGSPEVDIVFLDPPYDRPAEYDAAFATLADTARPTTLIIAQHASRQALEDRYGRLERYRIVKQGDNSLSFYRAAAGSA